MSVDMDYIANQILIQARKELQEEIIRAAVEKEKQRLRAAKWWHRFIPIITITWRKP